MKKLILLLAAWLAFSLTGLAQSSTDTGAAAQGSTGASSSDQGATTTKSKKKSSKEAGTEGASAKEHSVTGCLSGPDADGAYVLTNGRYKKGLEVGGNDELKSHVGHEVKLTGTWAKESDISGNASATGSEAKGKSEYAKHMKVDKIQHVAETCTSAKAGKGSKKGKGSSSTSTPPSM